MKKRISTVLAAFLLATSCATSLCACGSGGENDISTDTALTHSTKPTMPNDIDMQIVEVADAMQEINSFKDALEGNEYGTYQTYSICSNKGEYTKTFEEKEGDEWLGTTDTAILRTKEISEVASSYCGIKDNGGTIGAFSSSTYSLDETKIDSTNLKLEYANRLSYIDNSYTGIQNSSQIYVFGSGKYKDKDEEESVTPETFLYYSDDINSYKNLEVYGIPLVHCVFEATYATPRLNTFMYNISGICSYAADKSEINKHLLYRVSEDMFYGEFEVKDFEFTIKKNQNKIYFSTSYTIAHIDVKQDVYFEYSLLIDLSKPQSINSLSSNGKDVSNISLSSVSTNVVCPNITSEQLTQAVMEGKTITVDIIGGGDVNNLSVYGVMREEIPISDGKIIINGADIKAKIDNGKITDQYGNIINIAMRYIKFNYCDGNSELKGVIKINYDVD